MRRVIAHLAVCGRLVGLQKHAAAGGAAEGLSTYVEALDDLGGVAVLEKLMNHANVDIYSRVVSGKCWVLWGHCCLLRDSLAPTTHLCAVASA